MSENLRSKLFDMGLITTRGDHIPTLEENQARLRQQQADICKRLGYGIGPTRHPRLRPTMEECELRFGEVKKHQTDRDSIADLARAAIRAIEYAHVLFPVSSIEDAKKAVELILAECTKP